MLRNRSILFLSIFLMSTALGISSAIAQILPLMPMPAKVTVGQGSLGIEQTFLWKADLQDPRLEKSVGRFLDLLGRQTGMRVSRPAIIAVTGALPNISLTIHCQKPSKPIPSLGEDESYKLEITPNGAVLSAPTTLGVMRGLQTLLQLVRPGPKNFEVPALIIDDQPRFPWRGLMIDSGRHFIPLDVIKRNLDAMEAVKLNVFHWHLSEDQGFRIESKKFPKLTQLGSDGDFYTQDQAREIVAYAADRGIRVVPEFDMPGHSTSWMVGYPELGSAPGPYQIKREWGIMGTALDPTRESTYEFLDVFIGEMAGIFPDAYFHIGGDEVEGDDWKKSPAIQAFLKENHIPNLSELQAHFNRRIQRIVTKYGKRMEGWDEILNPDIPKDIVIQSWRGPESLAKAAKQGYSAMLSNGYYLDLTYTAAEHYLVDPISGDSAKLTPEEKSRILGGEAAIWSEYVSPETIDSRTWPRAVVIAERFWSPQETRELDSMYARMEIASHHLEWLGLTHLSARRTLLQRAVGPLPVGPVEILAAVLEPLRDYKRGEALPSNQLTPLTRLVDAVRPESDVARKFGALLTDMKGNQAEIRKWLTLWRDNDAQAQPIVATSFLLEGAADHSRNLAELSQAGLDSLDLIVSGKPASQDWGKTHAALVEMAEKQHAATVLAVALHIASLIAQAEKQ